MSEGPKSQDISATLWLFTRAGPCPKGSIGEKRLEMTILELYNGLVTFKSVRKGFRDLAKAIKISMAPPGSFTPCQHF